MIRILHVVSILNAGGMENYIMNLYRKMDRKQIQFDFMVHHKARGIFEDEIEALGGRVYHFSVMDDKNVFKYYGELDTFFKTHREYRIVHGHLSSVAVFYLGYAKRHGVPCRISHSHNTGFLHTPKGYAKFLLSRTAKWNATVRLACSTEAGRYLFGKTPYSVVPNGVDTKRFSFDPYIRMEVRKELNLDGSFVVGHVGRFNLQKNHIYVLRIFKALLEEIPTAKLLLLGDGELWDSVHHKAEKLGLTDSIIFAGVHKDVENYYHAMDAFILPSLFEGLPVTGIEAQYAGLPCFFADNISREVGITSSAKFLGIQDNDIASWCQELKAVSATERREVTDLTTNQFDIDAAAIAMAKLYQDMWEK